MKTAVLISGELRFLEECLPTMKFINGDVDVFVSTWNKTRIKNDLLGVDILEEITEERIRKILPNATILIEDESCFKSIRYNDKMIHRWRSGWELIKSSNNAYDRIVVTRSDLFFHGSCELSDDNECEFLWCTPESFLQDGIFSLPIAVAIDFFNSLSLHSWQTANNGNWHSWFTDFFKSLGPINVRKIFNDCHIRLFRATTNQKLLSNLLHHVDERADDWRDACAIEFFQKHHCSQNALNVLRESWPPDIFRSMFLTYKSGRLSRHKNTKNDTLVIYAGIVRNFDSACISLPVFGPCDVAVVSWDTREAYQFSKIIRADICNFYPEVNFELDNKSSLCENSQKMIFHWRKCADIIEKSNYKYIYICRPDAYIYASSILNAADMVHGKCISTFNSTIDLYSLQDQIFLLTRDGAPALRKVCSELLTVQDMNSDIHAKLAMAFKSLNVDPRNDTFRSSILDIVIQRDTFTPLWDDVSGAQLYLDLYSAANTWWRKNHNLKYDVHLPHIASIITGN